MKNAPSVREKIFNKLAFSNLIFHISALYFLYNEISII